MMFLSQENKLPFPKITPIRIPYIIKMAEAYMKEVSLGTDIDAIKSKMVRIEKTYRDWFNPLLNTEIFPHMYFMSNGITQALEYLSIHFKKHNIFLQSGDYHWLKFIGSGVESTNPTECGISYSSSPSAIDGSMNNTVWKSKQHILDGAYIGTTTLSSTVPENTEFLLLGFSKNLGLVELRCGLLLSKNPILPLEGMQKTFAHLGLINHEIIEKICKQISITDLAKTLKRYQHKFCSNTTGIDLIPSESALLATTKYDIPFYRRANGVVRIPLGESITNLLYSEKDWL